MISVGLREGTSLFQVVYILSILFHGGTSMIGGYVVQCKRDDGKHVITLF